MPHTPGPWNTSKETDFLIINPVNGVPICQVYGLPCVAEDEANAHLLAAAPELLEALVDLANVAIYANSVQHSGNKVSPETWSDVFAYANKARAVITKAQGN